jgi:hypothetical protein
MRLPPRLASFFLFKPQKNTPVKLHIILRAITGLLLLLGCALFAGACADDSTADNTQHRHRHGSGHGRDQSETNDRSNNPSPTPALGL